MMEALGALLGLLGVGLSLAGCAWLAWWMLEPINRVAGELQGTTRFMLTDVIGLMILLQIGLATTGRALSASDVRGETLAMYWLLLGLMCLVVLVLWAASVSVVSRAGILRPGRRIAVIVLCVPGTLIVMVALPMLICMLAGTIFALLVLGDASHWSPEAIPLLFAACLILVAAAVGLRYIAFWSLVGSPGGELLAQIRARLANPHLPPYPRPNDVP